MILRCERDDKYPDITEGKKYEVIQMTDNEALVQIKNDKGEIDWYPTFLFNY